MKISLETILQRIIWLLTLLLFITFLIFETYAWGRYVFFGGCILIALLTSAVHRGVLRIRFRPYYGFFALFIVYVMTTALWAWDQPSAIRKAVTLVQILGCSAMLYIHYDREDTIQGLLSAVKWAGYIVSVYAIFYYGLENLGLEEGRRLENEFSNVNTIGMTAALACVLQVQELLYKRSRWSAVMMIPAVVMVAATQSRKALVLLLAGVMGVYILKNLSKKGFANKLCKVLFSVAFVCVLLYLALRLPIFAGVMERMESMIAAWTGEGRADGSALKRDQMVQIGWEYFLKYPIGGTGFGSSGILTQQYLGWSTYLHNNYVELLSGGGVIGFLLYYALHGYILVNLIRYRKADPERFAIGVVWIILILIMDYGMVSYTSKLQWFYIMIHFMNVEHMKKKYREMQENAKGPVEKRN